MKQLKLALLALTFGIFSCSTEDETPVTTQTYNGVYVLNEGGFLQSNSSFTYFPSDFSSQITDLFKTVNPNEIMGDVAQSMYFNEDKAYVIVNNSKKIIILDRNTAKQLGTITNGINNPRYLVVSDNKMYISCWGNPSDTTDDYIAVIQLNFLTPVTNILVPEGPEKLLIDNGKIYVAHKGGYGFGNKVSVINTTSNTVSNTINTGDLPSFMSVSNNQLHVFCSGKPNYSGSETGGKFKSYNLSTYAETQSIDFGTTQHPGNFCIFENNLYYSMSNQIYKKELASTTIPTTPFLNPQVTSLYGINVFNNQIFVCDAKNFSSAGSLKVFSLTGSLITEKTTGIAPNGVYLN